MMPCAAAVAPALAPGWRLGRLLRGSSSALGSCTRVSFAARSVCSVASPTSWYSTLPVRQSLSEGGGVCAVSLWKPSLRPTSASTCAVVLSETLPSLQLALRTASGSMSTTSGVPVDALQSGEHARRLLPLARRHELPQGGPSLLTRGREVRLALHPYAGGFGWLVALVRHACG